MLKHQQHRIGGDVYAELRHWQKRVLELEMDIGEKHYDQSLLAENLRNLLTQKNEEVHRQNATIDELTNVLQSHKDTAALLRKAEETIESQASEIASLKTSLAEREEELLAKKSEVTNLEAEIAESRAALEGTQEENTRLIADTQHSHQQVARLSAQLFQQTVFLNGPTHWTGRFPSVIVKEFLQSVPVQSDQVLHGVMYTLQVAIAHRSAHMQYAAPVHMGVQPSQMAAMEHVPETMIATAAGAGGVSYSPPNNSTTSSTNGQGTCSLQQGSRTSSGSPCESRLS